jgi:hypothetical protein
MRFPLRTFLLRLTGQALRAQAPYAQGRVTKDNQPALAPGFMASGMARWSSIAFCSRALPKLFGHKEWSVYLSNSAAYQTFDNRKSLTVDKGNVFQIKTKPYFFLQHRLCGIA